MPDRVDLGALACGTQATAEVSVLNAGTRVAEIATVRASCNCVVPSPEDVLGLPLQPGDSVLLPFTFDVGFIAGHKLVEIHIETKDGVHRSVPVFVRVMGSWTLSEETINFGDVELGANAPVVRTVHWTSLTDEFLGLDIEHARWLTCESVRRSEGAVELRLKVDPDRLSPGLNTANAILRTSSPRMSRGALSIRARGLLPLQPDTDHVTLVGSDSKLIAFSDSSGNPAKLSDAVTDDPAIVGKVSSISTVEVSNPAGIPRLRLVELLVHDEGGNSCSVSVVSF